jgi:hypothetical protein
MKERITAEKAKELLECATPGPWQWSRETSPEHTQAVRLRGPIMGLAHRGERIMAPAWPHPSAADADLLAAAPVLAATVIAQAEEIVRLRGVMRREIANTDHYANCPMYGTADDADPRCNCVVGALYHALEGGDR